METKKKTLEQAKHLDKHEVPVSVYKIRPQGILCSNYWPRLYTHISENAKLSISNVFTLFKNMLDISQTSFHIETKNVVAIGLVTAEFVVRNYEKYAFAYDISLKLIKWSMETTNKNLVAELDQSISILYHALSLLQSVKHTFADENYVFGKVYMALYVAKKMHRRIKAHTKQASNNYLDYLHSACDYLSETAINIDIVRLHLLVNDMDEIENLIDLDLVDKCIRLDFTFQSLAQYIQKDDIRKFMETVITKDIYFTKALQMYKTLSEENHSVAAEFQSFCKQIEHFIQTSLMMIHGIELYRIGEDAVVTPFLQAAETGNYLFAIFAPTARKMCDTVDDITTEANKVLSRPHLLPCTYRENEKGFLVFEKAMQALMENHVSILRSILIDHGRNSVFSAAMFIKLYYEKLYSATFEPKASFADEIEEYIARFIHIYLKNFALDIPYRDYLIGEEQEQDTILSVSDIAYDTDKIAIDPEKKKFTKKMAKGVALVEVESPGDTDSDSASKRRKHSKQLTVSDTEELPIETADLHEMERANPGCTQPEMEKGYPHTPTTSTQSDASLDIFDEFE